MKPYLSALALSAALALSPIAHARPVTFQTTLKQYSGNGAYLALYLTDAQGAYVRTLWVSGEKSKYYKHLTVTADQNARLFAGKRAITFCSDALCVPTSAVLPSKPSW